MNPNNDNWKNQNTIKLNSTISDTNINKMLNYKSTNTFYKTDD